MTRAATNVRIPSGACELEGELRLSAAPRGVVAFAHGSGSSRHSPRNQAVARVLEGAGCGTLLVDLLTAEEEALDRRTAHLRFDIDLLAARMVAIVDWLGATPETSRLPLGLFGASTGAAAALVAAAERPDRVAAVVSRGGRPDLAAAALARVRAPVLLIVGSLDTPVIGMNQDAMRRMSAPVTLEIVPGASHLFEEPGTLDRVAELAAAFFRQHLKARAGQGT